MDSLRSPSWSQKIHTWPVRTSLRGGQGHVFFSLFFQAVKAFERHQPKNSAHKQQTLQPVSRSRSVQKWTDQVVGVGEAVGDYMCFGEHTRHSAGSGQQTELADAPFGIWNTWRKMGNWLSVHLIYSTNPALFLFFLQEFVDGSFSITFFISFIFMTVDGVCGHLFWFHKNEWVTFHDESCHGASSCSKHHNPTQQLLNGEPSFTSAFRRFYHFMELYVKRVLLPQDFKFLGSWSPPPPPFLLSLTLTYWLNF